MDGWLSPHPSHCLCLRTYLSSCHSSRPKLNLSPCLSPGSDATSTQSLSRTLRGHFLMGGPLPWGSPKRTLAPRMSSLVGFCHAFVHSSLVLLKQLCVSMCMKHVACALGTVGSLPTLTADLECYQCALKRTLSTLTQGKVLYLYHLPCLVLVMCNDAVWWLCFLFAFSFICFRLVSLTLPCICIYTALVNKTLPCDYIHLNAAFLTISYYTVSGSPSNMV